MSLPDLFAEADCSGSVHVIRVSDGTETGYAADQLRVMASVVKVAIAVEFYGRVAEGGLDPATTATLRAGETTPGPVGISRFEDAVTASLQDLAYLMLTISDNAATDVITDAVGVSAVNDRLRHLGCENSFVTGTLRETLDGVASDLGFSDYRQLLAAQGGELGPESRRAALDRAAFDRCRALDPQQSTRTTARDMAVLVRAIWSDTAAAPESCRRVRSVMGEQVTRRMAPAVPPGGSLAAKSGGFFGRVRNEIGAITDPNGEHYAFAVLTHANKPFVGGPAIDSAMAAAVKACITELDSPA